MSGETKVAAAPAIPECLARDLAELADRALSVLVMVGDLLADGERLMRVVDYLATAHGDENDYRAACGYTTFDRMLSAIFDTLRDSTFFDSESTITALGRAETDKAIAAVRARRLEAADRLDRPVEPIGADHARGGVAGIARRYGR